MSLHKVVLLLGSNLGDRKKYLNTAIELLNNCGIIIEERTEAVATKPVEFLSPNNFCNIALSILTDLSPFSLLSTLKSIERKMGRTEDSSNKGEYGDRIIDIDIVIYDGIEFSSEKLKIPHEKHLHQRDFSQKLIKELNSK